MLEEPSKEKTAPRTSFFLAIKSLRFIAIDIHGPLPKTKSGLQYIVVVTDQFPMRPKAILTAKTTAIIVAIICLEHLVSNFGKRTKVLTNNE